MGLVLVMGQIGDLGSELWSRRHRAASLSKPEVQHMELHLNHAHVASTTSSISVFSGSRRLRIRTFHCLKDPNVLKLRSLDSSCPFFLSDNSIWEKRTQMPRML